MLAARSDILLAAMSPPKKEMFLRRWFGRLAVPICYGVKWLSMSMPGEFSVLRAAGGGSGWNGSTELLGSHVVCGAVAW